MVGSAIASPAAKAADGAEDAGWKKAFMLGAVTKGPVLDHFKLLKEAGFEGVELLSPESGSTATQVLKARDETGLVIHGDLGLGPLADSPLSSPDPAVVDRWVCRRFASRSPTCKAYGGTTVLLVPAVVGAEGLASRGLRPVAGQRSAG